MRHAFWIAFVSWILAFGVLVGEFAYIAGFSAGKCDGINWVAREHDLAIRCK